MANKNFVQRPPAGTIHDAAQALAEGRLTSTALCAHLINRQERVDSIVNGFVHLDKDEIMRQASASDSRRASGVALSRFDGIPIAIKDNISVKNDPCGCASRILKGFNATYDATVISRLKGAGMICFGRTNMDEFAMGSSTENSSVTLTHNPWDTDRVPGGSSGGSAAVIASGQALAALGSDTGGSIRQPAGFCGVVGFKPTYGRVSRYGLVAFASSLDQIGPLTVDVEDAAILLDLIGGKDFMDCTSAEVENGGYSSALADFDLASLRIGVAYDLINGEGMTPDVRCVVTGAIDKFSSAGAQIIPIELPHTRYAVAVYYIIATAEASSNLARFDGIRYGHRDKSNGDLLTTYRKSREQGFGVEVKRRIILGTFVLSSGYYDAYYLRAQKMKSLIAQDFTQAFRQCDVIITPVSPTTAFPIGAVTSPLEMYLSDIFTIPSNLAGNCALAIPAGVDGKGLPVSLQMIADCWQERVLLQAGNWFMKHHPAGITAQEINSDVKL